MSRRAALVMVCVFATAAAFAGAPREADVQGMYHGTWRTPAGQGKLEARVIALGNNTFKVYATQHLPEGKTAKVELDGRLERGQAAFKGKGWSAGYAAGALTGKIGADGSLQLQRHIPQSPTAGKKPPEGAVVLLDGKSFTEMVRSGGRQWYVADRSKDGWAVWEVPLTTIVARQPAQWPTKDNLMPEGWLLGKDRRRVDTVLGIGEDGSIQVPRGGMRSRRQLDGSFDLHVEFLCPLLPTARGQGRGNSGVYLPCGEEIQVLDSFGVTTYKGGGCGGLYRWRAPDAFDEFSLASYPPLVWQTFDVEYRLQRGAQGKPVGKPRVTVDHNGIRIHGNVELNRQHRRGGFSFQDHGNPVRYRNIWVLPLKDKRAGTF